VSARTHELSFGGGLLERGFWLYVWEISAPGETIYYVGRTGDSSSGNAQSPFNRMGQHLGFREESNALRRQLKAKGIQPEQCSFRLVANGPILGEGTNAEEHRARRDTVAMEKALADEMCAAGYDVLNSVSCRKPLDEELFAQVLKVFGEMFPKLRKAAGASA
jgi:hypothetical protein